MSSLQIESAVQSYLRAVALSAYQTERVGPFQAGFHPRSDNPYLNYAIPDDDAHPAVDFMVKELPRASEYDGYNMMIYLALLGPVAKDALPAIHARALLWTSSTFSQSTGG